MAKRPTTTPLAPETPPKQFEATERSEVAENPTDIEDAPITTNSQSSASNTPASAEEGVTSPTDDVEDTSLALEEDALSPKEKKNKKATTSKKSSVKASTPKKKDGKAVTSKKKGDEASDSEKGDSAIVPEAKESKPPVGDGFTPYKHSIVIPAFNQFWGDRPVTGSARPAPDQPSARASNGQTNPPLFENRGYRYKRGSQLVKHHYTIDPANMASLPIDRDQEELLAVRLIDMRLNRKTSVPKRSPDVYCYGKRPRDWNSKQSIKALNDRRYQAIDRETMDAPWTEIEREYLARLIREDPDASILDLAERHNDRFMGQDYKESTGFMKVKGGSLSIGRTVHMTKHTVVPMRAMMRMIHPRRRRSTWKGWMMTMKSQTRLIFIPAASAMLQISLKRTSGLPSTREPARPTPLPDRTSSTMSKKSFLSWPYLTMTMVVLHLYKETGIPRKLRRRIGTMIRRPRSNPTFVLLATWR
jgi:hypothetical protein